MILLSLKLFRVSLLAASGSCAVGICGGESPPYLASPCSSPSHTPQPQACHILALQPSIAPSSFGNNNNFFFFKPGVLWSPLPDRSLPSSLISYYLASYPLSPGPAELFSSHTLCFAASVQLLSLCLLPGLPFAPQSLEIRFLLHSIRRVPSLSEVPLLPRIRCGPFHLLYTLHLIL